ncbi:MAG: DNA-binding Xre family transcriptional regulator [Parvicella sp.]|jgi:DNA-binding Xre family transcriptional regulator
MTVSVQTRIENEIKSIKRGSILFPSNFDDIGNVEVVKKSLLRLENKKFLVRLAHGIYLYPKQDKLLGVLYPTIEEIAVAIAERDKARIIPTGTTALNKLGLSTQIPMNIIFLTDGAPRSILVGKRTIKLKRTSPKNLAVKGKITSLIIQALKEIGKDNVTAEQLEKIKIHLEKEKQEIIEHDAKLAPAWISKIMKND